MTATLNGYRGSRPVAHLSAAARPGTDGASAALPPGVAGRVREAIRTYGLSAGWHTGSPYGAFLNHLTGETPEMRRRYPEMFFREASIKSPMLSAIWSVASLDLQVLPASKSNQRDRDIAEAYKYALLHAAGGMPQTASEILLPARVRGETLAHFCLREQVEAKGKYAGRRLVKAVKAKPPGSYQLRFDDYGNLLGVRGNADLAEYPPEEFIHHKWLSLEGSHGVGDLRAAFRAFDMKDAICELRFFFLDKIQGGFLVAKNVPAEQHAAMLIALEAARGCGALVLEPGAEVEALNIAMGTEAAFKSAIDDLDKEMMTAVGLTHLPFQQGHAGAERGNTAVQKEVSSQVEWKMAADVGYHLSAKAKLFVDENFAGADYPEVQLGGGVDPAATKAQLELVLLANTAVPVSAAQIYEISGAQPPKDARDVAPAQPVHPPAGEIGRAHV